MLSQGRWRLDASAASFEVLDLMVNPGIGEIILEQVAREPIF